MDPRLQDPFGYGSPPRSPEQQPGDSPAGDGREQTPDRWPASTSVGAEGTPKVPLIPFAGRPERACPGAPRKSRAPPNFEHTAGDAAVRRLSFGAAAGTDSCMSPEPSGVAAVDSMDEDIHVDEAALPQQQQLQECSPRSLAGTPAAGPSQPAGLFMSSQQRAQEQLLLSPSPPPVQQLFSQLPASQQQRPASVQQQLFGPAPGQSRQLRPQQLWPCQQQQQPMQQPMQQAGQPQQMMWPNPLSPAGAARPSAQQGSTTPARLFR